MIWCSDARQNVSTHSRPKAAGFVISFSGVPWLVSTHSRPKAAGSHNGYDRPADICFNTQPPEGGWRMPSTAFSQFQCFNTQPPEGGWCPLKTVLTFKKRFQHTAARRRLVFEWRKSIAFFSCFNTQPPEGGWCQMMAIILMFFKVSTHSRPKAAGSASVFINAVGGFQHTAARRRLERR